MIGDCLLLLIADAVASELLCNAEQELSPPLCSWVMLIPRTESAVLSALLLKLSNRSSQSLSTEEPPSPRNIRRDFRPWNWPRPRVCVVPIICYVAIPRRSWLSGRRGQARREGMSLGITGPALVVVSSTTNTPRGVAPVPVRRRRPRRRPPGTGSPRSTPAATTIIVIIVVVGRSHCRFSR